MQIAATYNETMVIYASCSLNRNGIPSVEENSPMVLNDSFNIGTEEKQIMLYNFIDTDFSPAKNLNVIVLRKDFTPDGLALVKGVVYLPRGIGQDPYFDYLMVCWRNLGILNILDESVLTEEELNNYNIA